MNWDDPVARYNHIESVGIDQYNRDIKQHFIDSTIEIVNGYRIRPVGSRFGRLFFVHGSNSGFLKIEQARDHANSLPKGPA